MFTNVSEVCSASIVIALMMEAVQTSETLVNLYQSARRYNPEDSHLPNSLFRVCFAEFDDLFCNI
jgi:hypothetical protein